MRKPEDLTGRKFGKLTAIEKTEKRYNGSVIWKCKCDCGNTIEIVSTNLKSGNTRSCGCLQKGFIDLEGKRFGKLTVIEQTSKRYYNNIVWRCRCDCGKEKLISANSLTSGRTTSCGCVGLEKLKEFKENNLVENTNIALISRKKPNKNSTSGVKGVYWISPVSMWEVQIEFQRKSYYLGRFKKQDKEKAIQVRKIAEQNLHGNFLEWYYKYKESNKKKETEPD